MGKCDLHKLREHCLLSALGLWKQRNAFPSGQCPSRAPTCAGTVLRCGCTEEPQSSLCCPSWSKSPLMDNFSTDLAEPEGILGLRSGTHLAGRWVAAPGWGLQGLWRGTATALPSPSSCDEFMSSCSPPCAQVCGCALCFHPFYFSPYFNPV